MTAPYYQDQAVTLWHGDSLAVLREMADASVDCCVTSPPYFGLRDYGELGQYGLEPSPPEYVETMCALFAEVRRVLADDGTLWLNLGDSYSASTTGSASTTSTLGGGKSTQIVAGNRPSKTGFLPTKNLMGIPWRVAFALQDDGWILRNDIIWAKPNAMPESVTDRLSNRHEHLFMFSKSTRYWFDLDPVREPHQEVTIARSTRSRITAYAPPGQTPGRTKETTPNPKGGNPGDVWSIPTQPFPDAHFAVMPERLGERAIGAGCKPGGLVLDPFSGSGTTGLAAARLGRRYVGIDLNREYLDLSLRTRLGQTSLLDGGVA